MWWQQHKIKENTQDHFWDTPPKPSKTFLGQVAIGGMSLLCCPPARFAAVREVSSYTLTFMDLLKPQYHQASHTPIWNGNSSMLTLPHARLRSLLTEASQGLEGLEEKQEGKFSHTKHQVRTQTCTQDPHFINLSMLEAVTAGCWDAMLAMTISCTSGLMIGRVNQTAGAARPGFNV